eukprot:gene8883-7083_t
MRGYDAFTERHREWSSRDAPANSVVAWLPEPGARRDVLWGYLSVGHNAKGAGSGTAHVVRCQALLRDGVLGLRHIDRVDRGAAEEVGKMQVIVSVPRALFDKRTGWAYCAYKYHSDAHLIASYLQSMQQIRRSVEAGRPPAAEDAAGYAEYIAALHAAAGGAGAPGGVAGAGADGTADPQPREASALRADLTSTAVR